MSTSKPKNWLVATLVMLLFTVVVDYMLLPALSDILLKRLALTTKQFGWITSVYGFSAGISSFLAMAFIDRFDRKRFLRFFYTGFLLGLMACTLSTGYYMLLVARILTGLTGGVIGAICLTIVADAFPPEKRGKVMGLVQMAYAIGLIGGLPLTMYLAGKVSWQFSYASLAIIGLVGWGMAHFFIPRMVAHMEEAKKEQPLEHALTVLKVPDYWAVFANNSLMVLGDMCLMTFNAAYLANNLKVGEEQLPLIYGTIGLVSLLASPLWGFLADRLGKLQVFVTGTVLAITATLIYTRVEHLSFLQIVGLHALLFVGVNARMVAATSLGMGIPEQADRGAFMSLDASLQQLAGGVAGILAGWIVVKNANETISHFSQIGLLVAGLMGITILLMYRIHHIQRKRS